MNEITKKLRGRPACEMNLFQSKVHSMCTIVSFAIDLRLLGL